MSLEQMRELWLSEAFALLREPRVWSSLRRLLTQQKMHGRLQAFATLFATLVPTAAEQSSGKKSMHVQIVNAIARPQKEKVITQETKVIEGPNG